MAVLLVLLVSPVGNAQEDSECDNEHWWGGRGGPAARVCETRELTLPATGALSVDAGPNGGIRVTGESRRDVQMRATVQAWGGDEAEAQRIAAAVVVGTDGTVRAQGPESRGRAGWSVSYEVLVPRETDLTLESQNGGIEIADVRGDLSFETQNGGISLDGVAGNVRGRTTNGGVDATLTGNRWDGSGLDLKTTNGGVRLRVPDDYSARLETGTVNGGIDIDFPVTVQGDIGKSLSTTLGNGGALVRLTTTNGGVRVSRGRGNLTRLE
jgi:DUF4097 and DUF4098 domain-containing protein YvlB